ncbi:DUF7260 family protein [Halostagnicola kamekurae]|uniref:DUF7260 domain-containing protein n=1 Tax=Halostagnicola kamekurae TaxID=619731 RepID=A0A1I6TIV5_9EURY|nr:hypothetical protein [Halostagnicola kamekurae]SFS89104.1 hypothetical protein SAMN04488556_3148 [Halostagnicola kamekurae]
MTDLTPIRDALSAVERTRDGVSETKSALDKFDATIEGIDPVGSATTVETPTAVGDGGLSMASATPRAVDAPNRMDQVRDAFVSAFCSEGSSDDPRLVETIERVFGTEVSSQLEPTASETYTVETERILHSAIERRRTQLEAVTQAIDIEVTSLEETLDAADPIVEWLETTREASLLTLEFETLFEHHETVSAHRSRCEAIVDDRQEVLHGTNSFDGRIGLAHRPFVESMYEGLEVRYPVLSTMARLSADCLEYERSVRDQLTRRV